jgi:hypothetical protein
MDLHGSHLGSLGFSCTDIHESVSMCFKDAICLRKILLKMALDTVWDEASVCVWGGGVPHSVRPKARGLAQHGGSPGWKEESDPAGCDFVHDGRPMPSALTDHTTYPGLGLIYN